MRKAVWIISVFFFCSCMFATDRSQITIAVEQMNLLPDIPSASGVVVKADTAFIISDDAPYLYSLALNDLKFRTTIISGTDLSRSRLQKMFKRDLEAFAEGKLNDTSYLYAFPSGGISPYRDTMIRFLSADLSMQQRTSILPLYEKIRQRLKARILNIEAAIIRADTLFLFDRLSNTIISVQFPSFNIIDTYAIDLPMQNKVQAGFSGACLWKEDQILFTASLEDTKNSIADGDVLGSYIGILDLKEGRPVLRSVTRVEKNGVALKEKFESLDRTKKGELIAVVDNDDGTSKLVRLKITE